MSVHGSPMATPVYIGDEVTAAGYRLAGVDIRVPSSPAAAEREFRQARQGGATLILLGAGCARDVPAAGLYRAMAAATPPVVIVPDAAGAAPVPDLAARIRARIGLE